MRKDKAEKSGRKVKNFRPTAREAIKQILALADAQIPFAAPAITIARKFIDTLDELESNDKMADDLLVLVQSYAARLLDLVQSLERNNLNTSNDPQTLVIREQIQMFEEVLASATQTIEQRRLAHTFLKFLGRSAIKSDLQTCHERLTFARSQLNDYMQTNIYINLRTLVASTKSENPISEFEREVSNVRIVGAKQISHEEVRLVKKVTTYRRSDNSYWYNNVTKAVINGETKLVKLYYKQSDGEASFLRDLQHLAHAAYPNLPRIESYCGTASTPFVVLAANTVTCLEIYLADLNRSCPKEVLMKAWRLLLDLRDAAYFLEENCPELGGAYLSHAMRAAVVDDTGEVIVAPPFGKRAPKGDTVIGMMKGFLSDILKKPEIRGGRSLGLALWGNSASVVLDKHPDDLPDPSRAEEYLRQLWLPPCEENRHLGWLFDFPKTELSPGDYGVLEFSSGRPDGFRLLGNIREDVPLRVAAPILLYQETAPGQFRRAYSRYKAGRKDFCSWRIAIDGWSYLKKNARPLASVHGVKPEDLVLVTQVTRSFTFNQPDFGGTTGAQVMLQVYVTPDGQFQSCNWRSTSEPEAFEPQLWTVEDTEKVQVSTFTHAYIQLEVSDLD